MGGGPGEPSEQFPFLRPDVSKRELCANRIGTLAHFSRDPWLRWPPFFENGRIDTSRIDCYSPAGWRQERPSSQIRNRTLPRILAALFT